MCKHFIITKKKIQNTTREEIKLGQTKKNRNCKRGRKIFPNFFFVFPIAKTNNRIIFTNTIALITYNTKIFKTFL
ncbi:hypothetical protein CNR22_05570 [Sphingobacteriaceae bacterium]|nr:hypothetical protein CNR22_05570 [Sphingobacteriaceae bacterium]